jgi:hypothetical protein
VNRRLALGAIGALAVAGGGVAYAAAGGSDPRQALLNDAAQRLNVSPEKLKAALQGAFADQLDQAVKDGKLTQQQADRMKQRLERGDGLPPFGGPPMMVMHGRVGGPFGDLKAAADYLGLAPAQLRDQVRGGKTLAEIAQATSGKTVAGLEQAILDAAKAGLDKAVANGRLTASQRDDFLKRLQQHVGDIVNGKLPHPGFRMHGPGGPGGPGGPDGPGSWGGPPPPPGP